LSTISGATAVNFIVKAAAHSIFVNPATGSKAPVPRHSEIDNRLAMKICRQLGIPPIRR
jgi:hypothetical protein